MSTGRAAVDDQSTPAAWRYAVGGALVLAPIGVLAFSPWRAATAVVLFAVLGALNAAVISARTVALTALSTAVIALTAVLLTATGPALPVLGTAFVAFLGYATAAIAPRGLIPVGAVRIALAAHLLVDPAALIAGYGTGRNTWLAAVLVAGTVLATSLWVLLIAGILLPGERRVPVVAQTPAYGLMLAVVCGAFTLIALVWFRGTNMWWTVLTVALVLQPAAWATKSRAVHRIVGTAVGGVLAAVAAVLIGSSLALAVLGVVGALGCIVLTVTHAPYWSYSVAVTVAVMLLTFSPSGILEADLERLIATITGAAVSAAAMFLAERFGPSPLTRWACA